MPPSLKRVLTFKGVKKALPVSFLHNAVMAYFLKHVSPGYGLHSARVFGDGPRSREMPTGGLFAPLGVSQISPCESTSGQVEISWQSARLIMFENGATGRSLPAVCVTSYHTDWMLMSDAFALL